MWISKITISNFRSFGDTPIEILLEKDLTGFIGLNSTGKTAALEAIRKLFGTTQQERELNRQDFHIPGDQKPSDVSEILLFIEVRLDFEEADEEAIPHFFEQMVIKTPGGEPYIRMRLSAKWVRSALSPDGEIEQDFSFVNAPEGIEPDESNCHGVRPHHRNKIQCIYVPAIRRPGEQVRFVAGTVLHRLIRNYIQFDEAFKGVFKDNIGIINTKLQGQPGYEVVQNSMSGHWNKFHKDKRYGQTKITFGGDDLESILRKIDIAFSPTDVDRAYSVDELGEGLRSLFYLTLICTLLEVENNNTGIDPDEKPLLSFLAVEEPENHIAPQLLGRVIGNLIRISGQPNAQVALTSHTPAIIKRIKPEAIRHFRLVPDVHHTIVREITLPDDKTAEYKYVKEAVQNYPELYFARLVVIGEGDSEEVVFNRLAKVYNQDFDDNIITFVPLGHRFVNHIWRLLQNLEIPYLTLLDLDLERDGGGWGRIKYVIKQLIQVGVDKSKILEISGGGILSDNELEKMHTWDYTDRKAFSGWLKLLITYDVFFSKPLDLDFTLLKKFPDVYQNLVGHDGPIIPDRNTDATEFVEKVKKSVQRTLKSDSATGELYSEADRELMIWYNYLFLGKGKPITHLLAISSIDDDTLKANLPEPLPTIFRRISQLL